MDLSSSAIPLVRPHQYSPFMNKTKVIWIVLILIMSSCYEGDKYKDANYNLVIGLNPWFTVDVNRNIIEVKFDDFQYADTMILSAVEMGQIKNSFDQNKIGQIEGEHHYGLTNATIHTDFLTFSILRNGRPRSTLRIEYDLIEKNISGSGEQYNVTRFRNNVVGVLDKNIKYQKAYKICRAQQTKRGIFSM